MLLPDEIDEELKLNIPYFKSLKSEKNMVLTKNFIDIRNAASLNEYGITFDELVYVKNQEVEAPRGAFLPPDSRILNPSAGVTVLTCYFNNRNRGNANTRRVFTNASGLSSGEPRTDARQTR